MRGSRSEVAAAAFFDLDRTLLRRSSALALAGTFRDRGLISRRQLAGAAAWQLLFVLRGASHESVRRAAEDGLLLLRGFTPEKMRALVADAMEPVLRPLVYAEPLHLVEQHRERGEPVYIVSATLQEIVEGIAEELGFDGALGTVCEVREGKYTGKAVRALHAENKAECIRELAKHHGLRSRREHGVLRQPHRPAVSRGGRASGGRESRPRAAQHRRRARLAGPRVRRARLSACEAPRPARRLGRGGPLRCRARGEQQAPPWNVTKG
jgi:HAD superfamily hydrolase (TIGR01490 family)